MSDKKYLNKPGIVPKLVGILLIAALLAGTFPQIGLAAPAPSVSVTCAKYHNVAADDTLSSISVTYDVSIAELASANDLKEPYTLFVGQRLCIPGTATSTTGTTTSASTSTKASWSVTRDGNSLVINAANFPTKANYYVKIKKGHPSTDRPWVKLGIFRTKKNTSVEREFRLPKSFIEPAMLTVCLKNAKTDAVSCLPYVPSNQQ
jgi:LysM repeat protein